MSSLGSAMNPTERLAELGRRRELGETERVHEHEAAQKVAVVHRETGGDRAAQRIPDYSRGRRGRCSR